MKKRLILGGVMGLILVLMTGCGSWNPVNAITGNNDKYDVSVERDEAEQLEVNLNLGVGEMRVAGGAEEWVTGELEYDRNKYKSKMEYDLDGKTGKVTINQKKSFKFITIFGEQKTRWDLQLSNNIPISLQVDAGASDTKLDLRGIQLSDLSVDAGVGDIEVDLSGTREVGFDASIQTGVGETTVFLPKDIGVRVVASTGIGSTDFVGFISQGNGVYVNDAYETADVIIDVAVETGVGETNFRLK